MSQHTVAIMSLLLFLLAGQTSVQGYVWCLDADGHVKLEMAGSNKCDPHALQPPGEECQEDKESLGDVSHEDHCGPCLDIPHSIETTSRNQQLKDLTPPAGLTPATLVLNQPALTRYLTSNHLSQPPPRVSQTILAHRTVVLLH